MTLTTTLPPLRLQQQQQHSYCTGVEGKTLAWQLEPQQDEDTGLHGLPDALLASLLCPFVPLRDRFYSLLHVSRRWRKLAWRSVYGDKSLDLTWCTGVFELDFVVKALSVRGLEEKATSKLEAFQLYGPLVTCSVLQHLVDGIGASSVRRIEIESKQADDAVLSKLSEFPELTHLTLHCVKLTAQALATISRSCPKLVSLDLAGCARISDDGIVAVASNCPALQELDLFMCHRLSDHSIAALGLRKSKTLTRVVVDRCLKISGPALRFLIKSQPNLRFLSFANCPKVQDSDFVALLKGLSSSSASLETVDMSGCALLSDTGATSLIAPNAATLLSLQVRALLTLSSRTFQAIARCTRLTSLNLSMCRTLENDDLTRIVVACQQLQHLKLQGCVQIDDDGAKAVAYNGKNLQVLSLEFCYNITDEGFGAIVTQCHSLRDINVKALNQLTVDAFDCLITRKSNATPLTRINIGACADFDTTLRYASIIKRRYPRARIEWT